MLNSKQDAFSMTEATNECHPVGNLFLITHGAGMEQDASSMTESKLSSRRELVRHWYGAGLGQDASGMTDTQMLSSRRELVRHWYGA
ncbi:MAG: hypothetical protein ACREOI_14230, partial [bacterium]